MTTLRIDLGNETIAALNRAILERRVVSLRYFGRNRAEITVRDVEPSRLSYVNGAWYLTAYCQVRRGERAFRLDRIESFSVQAAQFHPGAVAPSPHPPPLEVMVRFAPPASRWAQERQHWSFTAATQNNGDLVATYHPHSLEEIEHWILGWGSSAEVISPPELRQRLRREAQRIARMLT